MEEKHPKVRAIPNHDFDTYLAEVAIRMLEPTSTHYNKMDHFKKLKYNSGKTWSIKKVRQGFILIHVLILIESYLKFINKALLKTAIQICNHSVIPGRSLMQLQDPVNRRKYHYSSMNLPFQKKFCSTLSYEVFDKALRRYSNKKGF